MFSNLAPIALCLLSAITVAGANLFVKRGGDVLPTRVVMSMAMALCALPFAFFVPMPNAQLWPAIGLSLMVHWFYQAALIRSLHRGDLSLVFPVMRGLAPLLTAITATWFLKETPGPIGWIGLVIATAALVVFALPTRESGVDRRLQRTALFWAVVTAFGIASYSVVDAYGTRLSASIETVATFIVWLFLFDWIGITTAAVWSRRTSFWRGIRPQIRGGLISGVIGAISYGAALWAFTMTEAANVTAIRETSVVFGAIFGAVFLKESFGPRRIAAASVLAAGLMLLEFAP